MPAAPPYLSHLTNRLLKDPRLGHTWEPSPSYEVSAWINDELLVSKDVSAAVRSRLTTLGWQPVSSVLAPGPPPKLPNPNPGVVDIEIWKPAAPHYRIVEGVIADLATMTPIPKVSPNHLLVPCAAAKPDSNVGCYCPARPPKKIALQTALASRIASFSPKNALSVVVIDTGYIPHPALEARAKKGGFRHVQGQVFQGRRWKVGQPDGLYKAHGGVLDLLDGHGTFTAGVIAGKSDRADITLVGIRAIESAATEAAVIREVYRHASADVIVPVFAFHALHGMANWTFPNILPQLSPGSIVVSPAGNESSMAPHYPAGLPFPDYPVIGIGSFVSTKVPNGGNLSDFSDFGNWVFGYAAGEDVVGPYLNRRATIEEAGKAQAFNGWSSWSGTSFAAPKVAGALVKSSGGPGEARAAAIEMRDAAPTAQLVAGLPTLGRDLRQLAP